MKMKSDHRSKFSNLSNRKEEAWKISGLQRDLNLWAPRYRCNVWPTELSSHTLGIPLKPWYFSGFSIGKFTAMIALHFHPFFWLCYTQQKYNMNFIYIFHIIRKVTQFQLSKLVCSIIIWMPPDGAMKPLICISGSFSGFGETKFDKISSTL